ncbi:hypothetical protein DUY81_13305 [Acidipropionibacterium acidipropionici]|uniref:Lipoprotein n=1 Tax=Acidipropionibacterium acidipropionici TaxID=1748 RepID=A0AAC8YHA3_9ACTN|nr:hypothetical protein [Acidipropionibacterium acidipropionici]AMS06569.1 hypothetical protein AXH35_15055 [Acidipropionibacterium acidipropionici]AOZ48011.1 hypothetical protein A8L58_16505 [Acidipropionibacterium acidipropionici]AZP38637.1 hypothetical protein DUY81_13305 [Acidipropionibacterium acidipropionici]QCV95582.1 hypothetical protein FEZ30_10220 [Acidipropionibacterium acidipropionici]
MTTSSHHRTSPHRITRWPMRLAAAVAAAAALGTAGCAPSGSTAVQAGDRAVTMATFEKDVANCSDLASSQTMSPRQVIASTEVQAAVGEELLARSGRTLTNAQRDVIMTQNQLSALVTKPVCRDMGRRLASLYAVAGNSPDAATLVADVKKLGVQVNPRLGQWYPEQLAVAGSGSLSSLWTGARS